MGVDGFGDIGAVDEFDLEVGARIGAKGNSQTIDAMEGARDIAIDEIFRKHRQIDGIFAAIVIIADLGGEAR